METWDAIRSRRNIRQFDSRAIPPEHLDQILEAGRRSPSAQNWQPWDFVVVTDRNQLVKLAKVWMGAGPVAGSAVTIALVAPIPGDQNERDLIQYDLGQATMNIMLAATGLGIGTGHSGVGEQGLARDLLGIPEDRFCAYLIELGYPKDRPLTPIRRPNRRPFDQVVHRGRW